MLEVGLRVFEDCCPGAGFELSPSNGDADLLACFCQVKWAPEEEEETRAQLALGQMEMSVLKPTMAVRLDTWAQGKWRLQLLAARKPLITLPQIFLESSCCAWALFRESAQRS